MKIIIKILTFTIITLTALVLLLDPKLVRTMIPGIVEKIYVTINKIIPIERKDDLNLSILIVAVIMPIFAGIMRFISDFDDGIGGQIMATLLVALVWFIVVCFVCGFIGILIRGFILFFLFEVLPLFVIVSYIYCCYIMLKDFENCNCDCNCYHERCDFISDNCTTD